MINKTYSQKSLLIRKTFLKSEPRNTFSDWCCGRTGIRVSIPDARVVVVVVVVVLVVVVLVGVGFFLVLALAVAAAATCDRS